jgi:hypothetical protein
MNVQFVEVSGHNLEITCLLTKQFQATLARGGGGGEDSLIEVTLNSKEENS